MRTRWAGWLAAIAVTLVTIALVILDITDSGFRRWWLLHALTTSTVAGVLVLLITVQIATRSCGGGRSATGPRRLAPRRPS